MAAISRNKPVIDKSQEIGERTDKYLLRQLNANLDFPSTEVIDECAKLTRGKEVQRIQLPGIIIGQFVEFYLSVWWMEKELRFMKENGRWSSVTKASQK